MFALPLVLSLYFIQTVQSLTNLNVTRTVDLKSPVVRIQHDIIIDEVNKGYQFVIPPEDITRFSYISAWPKNNKKKPFKVTPAPNKKGTFNIDFGKNVVAPLQFMVLTIFIDELEPKPAEILQNDNQYVKYTGNVFFYSAYVTNKQETHFELPTGELIRYSPTPEPVVKRPNKLIYGPYLDKPAFHLSPVHIHFENDMAFLTVTKMVRLIEISHWGNIAVEESIDIMNCGAKLKGSFSRLDFDMGRGRQNAVTSFKTALPAAAKDIYYRDEIGNISSSAVRDLVDAVEVRISPRFPLLGGWKTQYILGYNIPAHEFLYRKGSQFSLRMRFLDHVYDDQLIKDFTLKVILPEAVTDVEFFPPYSVTRDPDEILKTYLDTTGRTVLVLKAKNLVTEHVEDFVLNYRFNMTLMLREPLMLIIAFCVIFACALIYVRLDFSIFRDEKAELRLHVQAIVDEALEVCRQRSALYQSYEDVIQKYKSHKDSATFVAERRKLEAEHKTLNERLSHIQNKLADLYNDGVEKLKECASLDVNYRDLVQSSAQLAERLINGKLTKPQYQTAENEMSAKKTDLIYRIDTIMENL